MKQILFFLSLIIIFSCTSDKTTVSTAKYIIAPESTMIIKFSDFSTWKATLSGNTFISKHKANGIVNFWSLDLFEGLIDIPNDAVLSFSSLGNNKSIKTLSFDASKSNKLKIESKQSYQYDEVTINAFELSEGDVYYSSVDGKAIFCTSKIILENIIRNYKNDITNPGQILKLLDVLSDKTPSLVINNETFPEIILEFLDKNILKQQLNLSDYSGFDINVDEDKILLSGIVFEPGKNEKSWSRFKNVEAQKSTTVNVIPGNFKSSTSILFSDFQKLFNITEIIEQKQTIDSLYVNIREISSIKLSNAKAMAIASNDIDQTFKYLEKTSTPQKTIGDNVIYKLTQAILPAENFNSILGLEEVNFFTVHMDYVLFSNTIETIENLIIQINNKNVVANQANYHNHIESLNSECHIQWLTNLGNQKDFIETHATEDYKSSFKTLKWDNYELLMSQLIVEEDFGYFNILHKKTVKNQKNVSIEQLVRLKSENNIIGTPTFFENWRTGQQDVVYQDDQNSLYKRDTKGNLIWSKKLDNPVIGDISSIDIYQNRRIQLAFVTKNKIHIIDKNGNDVKPFPLQFKDEITQGLSVFDYDNNGKYRFTIVFDDDIKMYDKEAKQVRGFRFKKSKTAVDRPVKHVRMSNKDYILAQEESNFLHILDRRGKTRIDLDKDLKLPDSEWFEHDNYFTTINDDGEILKIDQNGKLSRKKKDFLNPKFSANQENLVVLSENKFYFNSNQTELPYGLYTNPIINKNYAGLADKQAQKIYILNSNADLIEGFPVYCTELLDFYSNEKELEILCKESNYALIVYKAKFR